MASHAERVLSAVLNKENPRRDLMGVAVLRLEPEHFAQDTHRNIFRLLVTYFDRTGGIMPEAIFTEALESADIEASKIIAYTKTYEHLAKNPVGEADFRWSVDELRAEQAKRLTGVAITEAMEILERGYEDQKGNYHKGHEDARAFLTGKLHDIDRLGTTEVAPEGNIFLEYEALLEDYEKRKSGESQRGILTGIEAIDSRTAGFQPGELCMICAYAGVGKSQIATQATWHAAVIQKKNIFFATSETLREQVMRRIIARHSRLPMFDHPIDSADIKKGTLSPADEKVFRDVLEDWHYNTEYGTLNVVQIPAEAKLSYVDNRLRDYARNTEVDLCVIDYLALLKAQVKRASEREEFNEIIRGAKGIAQGFNGGVGIPVVSPWQITRDAYDRALHNGYYTKASLSDTSEAEKSADQIIALIREEDNNREMSLQFLKMRDDEIPPITRVAIDFRNSYIGSHVGPVSLSAGTANNDDLLTYLV